MDDAQDIYSGTLDTKNHTVILNNRVTIIGSKKHILRDRWTTIGHPFKRIDPFFKQDNKRVAFLGDAF
jgi:hypothetical protein